MLTYSNVSDSKTLSAKFVCLDESITKYNREMKEQHDLVQIEQVATAESYLISKEEFRFLSTVVFQLFLHLWITGVDEKTYIPNNRFTLNLLFGCALVLLIIHSNCNRCGFFADLMFSQVQTVCAGVRDSVLTSSKGILSSFETSVRSNIVT